MGTSVQSSNEPSDAFSRAARSSGSRALAASRLGSATSFFRHKPTALRNASLTLTASLYFNVFAACVFFSSSALPPLPVGGSKNGSKRDMYRRMFGTRSIRTTLGPSACSPTMAP
jgi:hypothetical protein